MGSTYPQYHECDAHGALKERVDKIETNHNKLYDRVRTNETKYMPAVDAAFKANADIAKVKEEMQKKLNDIKSTADIQDIKLDGILKRMDINDEQRTAQAASIDAVHADMLVIKTTFKTSVKIIGGFVALFTASLIGFGVWLVLSITENQSNNRVLQEMLKQLTEQEKYHETKTKGRK